MRSPPSRDDELRRVYRAHVRAVFGFLAYAVGRDVAEDVTATTFERAISAWDRFDPTRASERTWLLAIARNALTDHYRRQEHRRAVSTDEHPALLDRLVSSEDPEAGALARDGIVTRLKVLGERDREVLALRFGADLAASDVAQLMHLSEDNVHQITSRALRRLRARERDPTGSGS